jgi:hypothetical protein
MSLLTSCVESAPGQSYFAAAGSGGGASLVSPVAISPNPGDGSASLIIPATAGSLASITIGNGPAPWEVSVNPAAATNFKVSYLDGVTNPVYINIDDTIDSVALGSGAAGGVTKSFSRLDVSDLSIPSSSVVRIAALSASGGQVTNAVASTGSLTLGSSLAASNTITLSDAGALTAACLVGGNGGTAIQLRGGAAGVDPAVYANAISAGTLKLGSSVASPDNIVMTDTNTTIKNLTPPVLNSTLCSVNGSTTQIANGTFPIVLPIGVTLQSGLYYFAVNITGGANELFQVSTIVYYNASSTAFTSGGSAASNIDGLGNKMILYPNGADMVISYSGSLIPGYVAVTPLFVATIAGF